MVRSDKTKGWVTAFHGAVERTKLCNLGESGVVDVRALFPVSSQVSGAKQLGVLGAFERLRVVSASATFRN